ncbi:MAG: hypothetical protein KC619_13170, partial [Myxococcales bacterium]|nr:hypothetical protein [Myxococcales bacterium]
MNDAHVPGTIDELLEALAHLRDDARAAEAAAAEALELVPASSRRSARNLVHYLALRRHDLRRVQPSLTALGLSSLGRAEADTLPALEAVVEALEHLRGARPPLAGPLPVLDGKAVIERNADALFGPPHTRHRSRLMVTMPTEAATDPRLIDGLVAGGMDICRINGAHDGPAEWMRMVERVRAAEVVHGRRCRIQLDLAGPKLRTGPLPAGPKVRRIRPPRDERGRPVRPSRIALYATAPPDAVDGAVPVDASIVAKAKVGDRIALRDARDRRRRLEVVEVVDGAIVVGCDRTVVFETGLPLALRPTKGPRVDGTVGELPPRPGALRVATGDVLLLTAGDVEIDAPAAIPRVSVSLPEVLADLRPNERVLFDDGRIAARVIQASPSFARLEVERARGGATNLGGDKGINLPDSDLGLPALSDSDLELLDFAVAHADLVGMSFVRRPLDVAALHEALAARGSLERIGVVLKIETQQGFERLPQILLEALRLPKVGVMVARGDLAVEMGFERLAEVQEEICWLCEAAHVPVIWAT